MLPREENELLTLTGPGTPCGDLMRRYWQPIALSEELPAGGAPMPVRLLGEDLVLFRDDQGRPGLLGLHCSHRGADLSYGRLEAGGLRCIYHGWLYDVHGRCLEQPGEPAPRAAARFRWTDSGGRDSVDSAGFEAQSEAPGSTFHEKIQHPAYPCVERAGTIFAYLGPGEPPLFPNYDFLAVPDDHVFPIKRYHECNYLQANEGNIDISHTSFLHYMSPTYRNGQAPDQPISSRGAAPCLESADTDLTEGGLRSCKIRRTSDPETLRIHVTEFVIPNFTAFYVGPEGDSTGKLGYSVNWHVPIDDTHHWKYTFIFGRLRPLKGDVRVFDGEITPEYDLVRTRANRYLQDRELMKEVCYAGMGPDFQSHDKFATEGQGPIQDRTQEHLGAMDTPVVIGRKLLLKAIQDVQEGRDPANVVRDPAKNHFPIMAYSGPLPAQSSWAAFCRELETRPAEASPR